MTFSPGSWLLERNSSAHRLALEAFRLDEPEVHDFLMVNLGSDNKFIRSVAHQLYTTKRLSPRQIEAVRLFIDNRSK